MRELTHRSITTFLMTLPLVIILVFFSIYPFVSLIKMSFSSFIIGKGYEYVGLKNVWRFIEDQRAWESIGRTFLYVFVSVSGEFVVGLGLALLVKGKFKGVIRTMVIIPMLVAPIAVGIIWRLMYDPVFGIINQILAKIGIQGKNWLADPQIALWSVIIVEIWQWTPFIFLILLAGLESLPRECYEGAKIDGASSWQAFVYFTIPLMSPIIIVALFFRTMECFKAFDKIWILTGGGPSDVTEIISIYIYRVSFRHNLLGYGAFLALIMVGFIVIYNLSYMGFLRRKI
ncbi:Melibiose/raffinose/stachyose import permease protein MelD [subsurface metagenome]